MVGLAGEVGGHVVVLVGGLEGVVAGVAPQHRGQAQRVGLLKGPRYFENLAVAFLRTEVHGGPHGGGPQLPGLPHRTEHNLVELIGVGQQLVVVDFDHERNLVGVLARHRTKRAERGGHGVATAFHGQPEDVFGVEIHRIGAESGTRGVLNALVDGQDAHVAGAGQAAVVVQRPEAAQHLRTAAAGHKAAVEKAGAGRVNQVFAHHALVGEQGLVFGA